MTGTTTERRYGVNAGMAVKVPCRVASTGNITISGVQTIDGVSVVEDDRVLLKDQADPVENGIYDVSTGSWTRSPDFDGVIDVTEGTLIPVNDGSVKPTIWRVITSGTITPGTTALTFELSSLGALGTTTALVTHNGGFVGSTIRTVQERFNEIVYITDFANVDSTGVTDSTVGLTAARDYIASLTYPVTLVWTAGIYLYSVSPNWAITKLTMECHGDVRLRYTGTGNALIFDGGETGNGVYDVRAGRFYIEAPSTAEWRVFASYPSREI